MRQGYCPFRLSVHQGISPWRDSHADVYLSVYQSNCAWRDSHADGYTPQPDNDVQAAREGSKLAAGPRGAAPVGECEMVSSLQNNKIPLQPAQRHGVESTDGSYVPFCGYCRWRGCGR